MASLGSLLDVVSLVAHEAPSRVAVQDEAGIATYAEVVASAGLLSQALCGRRISSSASTWILGSHLPRSIDWVALFLAANSCCAPLVGLSTDLADADQERERSAAVLKLLQPALLVVSSDAQSQGGVLNTLPSQPLPVLTTIAELLAEGSGSLLRALPCQAQQGTLACYCVTGGSVRPKCVAVTQRQLLHEVAAYPGALGLEPGANHCVWQPSSLHWGAAVYGQLDLALALHGTLAVTSQPAGPGEVLRILEERQVTVFGLPPSLLLQLDLVRLPRRISCVIAWGEPCPPQLPEAWRSAFQTHRECGLPVPKLFDLLIATEYWLSFARDLSDLQVNAAESLAFLPCAGLPWMVAEISEATALGQPAGMVGELCIGGDAICASRVPLCAGRMDEVDESDGLFVVRDGMTYLRTGDVVRRSGSGVVVEGRVDALTKGAGGVWIDMEGLRCTLLQRLPHSPTGAPAEAHVLRMAGILVGAVATVAPHERAAELAAQGCKVAKDTMGEWTDVWRATSASGRAAVHSGAWLQVPALDAVVLLPAGQCLPRHPATGKVVPLALQELLHPLLEGFKDTAEQPVNTAAKGPAEAIRYAVDSVLPGTRDGMSEGLLGSLRQRGGDSLAAWRILGRLHQLGYGGLSVQALVEAKDLGFLDAKALGRGARLAQQLRPRHSTPLSPVQRALQAARLHDPVAYLLQFTVRLPEGLQPAALRAAWQAALTRHSALRCTYSLQGGAVEETADSLVLPWQEVETQVDLAGFASAERETPLPDTAPLMRLVHVGPAEAGGPAHLVWTFHHVMLDGWSATLLLDDVLNTAEVKGAGHLQSNRLQSVQPLTGLAVSPTAARRHWRVAGKGLPRRVALPRQSMPRHRLQRQVDCKLAEALQTVPVSLTLAGALQGLVALVLAELLPGPCGCTRQIPDSDLGCNVVLVPLTVGPRTTELLADFLARAQAAVYEGEAWSVGVDHAVLEAALPCCFDVVTTVQLPSPDYIMHDFEAARGPLLVSMQPRGDQTVDLLVDSSAACCGHASSLFEGLALALSAVSVASLRWPSGAWSSLLRRNAQLSLPSGLPVSLQLPAWLFDDAGTPVCAGPRQHTCETLEFEITAMPVQVWLALLVALDTGHGVWLQGDSAYCVRIAADVSLEDVLSSLGGTHVTASAGTAGCEFLTLATSELVWTLGLDRTQLPNASIIGKALALQAGQRVLAVAQAMSAVLQSALDAPATTFASLRANVAEMARVARVGDFAPEGAAVILSPWFPSDLDDPPTVECLQPGPSLGELVLQAAERKGQAALAVWPDLSYGQLLQEAQRWAASALTTSQPRLGVFASHADTATLPVLVGLVLAKVAYVPLVPDWPLERLRAAVITADLAVAAVPNPLHKRLASEAGLQVLQLQARAPEDLRSVRKRLEDGGAPLVVLFTSGSTGKPKAVELGHRAVLGNLVFMASSYEYGPSDRALVQTSLSWVAHLPELWAPLLAGAVLVPRGSAASLAGPDPNVTLATFTPSMFRALLAADCIPWSLRVLILTGEPLPTDLVRRIRSQANQLWVVNHYGQTEAVDTSTALVLRPQDGIPSGASVPIGVPIWWRACLVESLSASGEGELLVAGPVGRYLDTEADKKAYTTVNIGGRVRRAARTGDAVRWCGDTQGGFVCLGRRDAQVKVRGQRLDLAEVEATLRKAGATEAAAAVRRPVGSGPGSEKLVAWVQLSRKGAGASLANLHKACEAALPAYARPWLVAVEVWPRTTSGKVDKNALPLPENADSDSDTASEAGDTARADPVGRSSGSQQEAFSPAARRQLLRRAGSRGFWTLVLAILARCDWRRMLALPLLEHAVACLRFQGSSSLPYWVLLLTMTRRLPATQLAALTLAACLAFPPFPAAGGAHPLLFWLGGGASQFEWEVVETCSWYLASREGLRSLPGAALQGLWEMLGSRKWRGQPHEGDEDAPPRKRRRVGPKPQWLWHLGSVEGRSEDISEQTLRRQPTEATDISGGEGLWLRRLASCAGPELESTLMAAPAGVRLGELVDSLRLLALLARLQHVQPCRPPPLAQAMRSTPLELARYLAAQGDVPKADSEHCKPASGEEEGGNWRLGKYGYFFRIPLNWLVRLPFRCEPNALQQALTALCQRHAALRLDALRPRRLAWRRPAATERTHDWAGEVALWLRVLCRTCPRTGQLLSLLLYTVWPRSRLLAAGWQPHVVDAGELESEEAVLAASEDLTEAFDGRPQAQLWTVPSDRAASFLHLCFSHAAADGDSAVAVWTDLLSLLRDATAPLPPLPPAAGLQAMQERLQASLLTPTQPALDLGAFSWLANGGEGYRQQIRLAGPAAKALRKAASRLRVGGQETALVALLGAAFARVALLGSEETLRLGLVVPMREAAEEGLLVADLAEQRLLELRVGEGGAGLARRVAARLRARRWRIAQAFEEPPGSQPSFLVNAIPLLPLGSARPLVPMPQGNHRRCNSTHTAEVMATQLDQEDWLLDCKLAWHLWDQRQLRDVLAALLDEVLV